MRVVAETLVINFADGFDRQPAGFLTALVSAHAVGDDGESSLAVEFLIVGGFPIKVGVLIVLALAANVTQGRHFNAGSHMHEVNGQSCLPNGRAEAIRNRERKIGYPLQAGAALCPGHYRQEQGRKLNIGGGFREM